MIKVFTSYRNPAWALLPGAAAIFCGFASSQETGKESRAESETAPEVAAVEFAFESRRIDLLRKALEGFDVNRPLFEEKRRASQVGRRNPPRSLLPYAAGAGWTDAVRLAVEKGADLERDGYRALYAAVVRNRLSAVTFLLEAGVDPFIVQSGRRWSLLTQCLRNDASIEVIEALAAAGALASDLEDYALRRAWNRADPKVMAWLKSQGIAVPDTSDGERLIRAVRENDPAGFKEAIQDSYLSKRRLHHAETVAAATDRDDFLRALAFKNRNTRSYYVIKPGNFLEQTPLWFAAARGNDPMVEWLFQSEIDVDARTFSRQTPLMAACDLGRVSTVRLLLAKGASVQARDDRGWAPLDYARRSGSSDLIEIIEAKGGTSGFPEGAPPLPADPVWTEEAPIAPASLPENFPAPVVALAPVEVNDAYYASLTAGDDLWEAVQGELHDFSGVKWVERGQLEKIAAEWTLDAVAGRDAGTALSAGRLAGADWIVTGRLAPDEGRGRRLTIDVLDTRSAERLARRTLILPGPLGHAFAIDPGRIRQTTLTVQHVLRQAAETVRESAGKKRLAALFFESQADSERLESLASRAGAALALPEGTGVHVMQFREAGLVSGEAQLAAAEWLEESGRGFHHPADGFAWGSVSEAGNTEAPFPEVQIRFEWHLWDGIGPPRDFAAECPVAEADTTLAALSRRIHEAIRPSGFDQVTPETRRTIAVELFARADELRGAPSRSTSPRALRLRRQRREYLEAAHFFLPEDPVIEAHAMVDREKFRSPWDRHNAWGRFVGNHGFEPLRAARKESGTFNETWPLRMAPIETQYVHVTSSLTRQIDAFLSQRSYSSILPFDTPAAVRHQWLEELVPEFRRRLQLAAASSSEPLVLSLSSHLPVLERIADATERYRAMEIIWKEIEDWSKQTESRIADFRTELIAAAEDAGLADEAQALLRKTPLPGLPDVTQAPSPPKRPETPKALVLRNLSDEEPDNVYEWERWWETNLKARYETQSDTPGWLRIPAKVFTIEAQAIVGGGYGGWKSHGTQASWIESGKKRKDPGVYDQYAQVRALAEWKEKLYIACWSKRGPSVWEYDPATGKFHHLPDLPEISSDKTNFIGTLSGFLPHETGLWMAGNGHGIWHYDWSGRSWNAYGIAQGLPSLFVSQAGATAETVYFKSALGNKLPDIKSFISAWVPETGSWRTFRRSEADSTKKNPFFDKEIRWTGRPDRYPKTENFRPAVPELALRGNGAMAVVAETEDWKWLAVQDTDRKKGRNSRRDGTRLYAIHAEDGEIRGATCIPTMGSVLHGIVFRDHLWIPVLRREGEPVALLAYPLKDVQPPKPMPKSQPEAQ